MAVLTHQIPEWKTKQIAETAEKIKNADTIAIVDIKGLPGQQFHNLRAKLRKDMDILVRKKIIILRALEKIKVNKKGIEQLAEQLGEMPALIFSQKNPFQLSKLLSDNKAPAFAKAGDVSPEDISVDEGPTPFTPGPMISELSAIGLKVKVDAGKIVVMKKSTIAKAGEAINAKVADILVKLGVQPMSVGLELSSAWENEFVFAKDVLRFDVQEYLDNITLAASMAFKLSIGLPYPTKDNIQVIIPMLYNQAKTLALEQDIFIDALVPQLLSKAQAQAGEMNKYFEEHKPAEATTQEPKVEEAPVEEKEEKPQDNTNQKEGE